MPRRPLPRWAPVALVAALAAGLAAACDRPTSVALHLVPGGDGTPVGVPVRVSDRLFVIPGGGGNTGVFITGGGVLVVDPKYAASWPALEAAIRTLTDRPITYAAFTHSHSDHAEAAVRLPPAVRLVAHPNTLERMEYYSYLPRGPETDRRSIPVADRLRLFEGEDAVTFLHPGPAHTDGDLLVYFEAAHALQMGDIFPGLRFPIINHDGGGDGVQYPDTLEATLAALPGAERIITGHGPVLARSDLAGYTAFMQFTVDYVHREMGMFKDKAAVFRALRLPDRFRDYDRSRQFDTLDEIDRSLRPRWKRVF